MKTAMTQTAAPMSREDAFTEAISTAKRRHHELILIVEKHPCFAHLWEDTTGPCEFANTCAEAKLCKETWKDAISLQNPLRRIQLPTAAPPLVQAQLPPPVRAAAPPQLGVPAVSAARPVDAALDRFVLALGNPPVLHAGWLPTDLEGVHMRRGRMLLSHTPNFTSIYIDGVMRLRFETNAAGRARVEIVDELVLPARKAVGLVEKTPAGSRKKVRPCTHRVTLHFQEEGIETVIDELAAAVLRVFHFEGTRG